MKAAVHRRFGSPDVVRVDDVPEPVPRDDEVLVRVHAATVGVVDGVARRGTPFYARFHFGLSRPRFAVLGTAALSRAGIYLTTAPSLAILLQMPWTSRFSARKAVVAFTGLRAAAEKRKDLLYIAELAEASALTPVIDACYPLHRIADAHRHVEDGRKRGNIIITMTDLTEPAA